MNFEEDAQRNKQKAVAPTLHRMDTILLYGKHRGEKISTVLDIDPGWIMWALESVKDFDCDKEVEQCLKISLGEI